MKHTIARSSDEIRDVLAAIAGEHLPTRKAYLTSAVVAIICGIIAPAVLLWALTRREIELLRDLESLVSLVVGPLVAIELVRIAMSRYVVGDSHIACIAPMGFGSWTVLRAEIERIEVSVSPVGMSLLIHSGLPRPQVMPLRKRYTHELLRRYPELRRVRARVSVEERKRQQRSKLAMIAFGVILVAMALMVAAMIFYP